MLFGAVFMSMPLAIIGNEYGDAWSSLKSEKTIEAIEDATDSLQRKLPLQVGEDKGKSANTTTMLRKMSSTEVKKEAYSLSQQALLSPLIECRKNLDSSVASLGTLLRPAKKMNPAILLAMCELRGWIAPLLWNIRVAVRAVSDSTKVEASETRKLSVFRAVLTGPNESTSAPSNSVAPLAGYVRPEKAKATSHGSSLGALQETPEEDEDKADSVPSPTNIPSVPVPRRGRAPTAHPNPVSTKSHMTAVKKFLSAGIKPESAAPGTSNSGVPLRPSFWPAWGGSTVNNTSDESRVAPLPSQPSDSEDEKSGEDVAAAVAPEPGSRHDVRPTQNASDREEILKQIKLNRANQAVASLQKQPSLAKLTKQRSMESMTFLIKLAKAAPDIAKMRGNETEFSRNMERAVANPKAIRTKLWMVMELPSSSRVARCVQLYLLFLIMLSVLSLYTQTLPSFSDYSESSDICGRVLNRYCENKKDSSLDPGCFVQDASGPTLIKLKYGCTSSNCFGYGLNFGSKSTNMTCDPERYIQRPFQTSEELIYNYRPADFTVSRDRMHQIEDVCSRIECRYDSTQIIDGNAYWLPIEILINLSFTLEILVRVAVSFSWSSFFFDLMNLFDILSVIPFYLDIINGLRSNSLNFSIISSSPDAIIFITMKSLKVPSLFHVSFSSFLGVSTLQNDSAF